MREKEKIDTGTLDKTDLLIERADQLWRPAGCEKAYGVRRERQRARPQTKRARPLHDAFQNFLMSKVKTIEVSDAHDGRLPEIRIGQRR